MSRFTEALNEQIAYEFGASQQYVAIAVHYDAQTLPQLAAHFYRQAVEERNHAMMMVQYLLDADEQVLVPAVEAPQVSFPDVVAPGNASAPPPEGIWRWKRSGKQVLKLQGTTIEMPLAGFEARAVQKAHSNRQRTSSRTQHACAAVVVGKAAVADSDIAADELRVGEAVGGNAGQGHGLDVLL